MTTIESAEDFIRSLSPYPEHECACVCDRCKKGKETFLLPADIHRRDLETRLDELNQIKPSLDDECYDDIRCRILDLEKQIEAAEKGNV